MILTLLFVLIGVVFTLIIYQTIKDYNHRSKIKHITTSKPIPGPSFFSFLYQLLVKRKSFFEINIEFSEKYGRTYGSAQPIRGLGGIVVTTSSPEFSKTILRDTKTFDKIDSKTLPRNAMIDKFISPDNVVSVTGKTWQRHRISVDPGFYNLDSFVEVFNLKSKQVINKLLKDQEEGKLKDLHTYTQSLTLDILGLTIYGYDFNSVDGNMKHKGDLEAYDYVVGKLFSPLFLFFRFMLNFKSIPMVKKMDESIDKLVNLADRLIENSIERFKNEKGYKPKSMLDHMVQSSYFTEDESKKLSKHELKSNIMIFFIAGHDTTSSALAFSLQILALNPDIQEKLRKKIIEAHTDENGKEIEITSESVRKVDYLSAFIKENMRLFPPVVALQSRVAQKKVVIDGYKVPKGTMVGVNFVSLQRSKEIYGEDAEVFRPERWLEKEAESKLGDAWFPFSAGKRVCVGNNFSLLEQKVFLSHLLRSVKVCTEGKQKIKVSNKFISFPEEMPLKFTKVN